MSAETIESAAADAAAAPLDLLLTDAALGVLNRVNPGGSGLRLAAALAARPRLVAGRTRNLLGELARIAAGTSQVQSAAVQRPGMGGEPAAAPGAAGLPGGRADGGGPGAGRGPGLVRHRTGRLRAAQPDRRAGAEQQPGAQPGGAEGGDRHRRRQRPGGPAALRRRHGEPAADTIDGGAGRVRGRGGSRGHARGGGAADRRVRADPVPPGHARGPADPAADRPADDQQVLRDRPGPRPQHGRVPGRQRHAGVHDVLAQPGLPARQVGLQHLRSGGARRHGRGRADHGQRADRDHRGLLGRHHRRHGGRAPGAHRPAGPDRRADPAGHRAGPGAGRPGQRRHRASGPPGWPRPRPPRAATWTAGRWPRCSPGCGRTT